MENITFIKAKILLKVKWVYHNSKVNIKLFNKMINR